MKVSKKNSLLLWGGAIILIIFIVYFINKNRKIEHFAPINNIANSVPLGTKEDTDKLNNIGLGFGTILKFSPIGTVNATSTLFAQAILNMSDDQKKNLITKLENYCKTSKISTTTVGKDLITFWNNNGNSVKKTPQELKDYLINKYFKF